MKKFVDLRGVILTLFFLWQLFYLVPIARAITVNFTSADVTLTNSRLSYRAMIDQATSTYNSLFTISTTPISPATDSNTNNLFINDSVCFTEPNSSTCVNQTMYKINSLTAKNSFNLSSQVEQALPAETNVVVKQPARWIVRFIPRTSVPAGGFLKLTIPDTAANNADGLPDALGFDSGSLPSDLLHGACGSNACLSFSGFSASDASLTTTSSKGHVITITLSSGLSQGTPYSFILGSLSNDSLRMLNPSSPNPNYTTGASDTYPVALLSEDTDHNALDTIIMKLSNTNGVQVSASVGEIGEGGIPVGAIQYRFFLYGYSSPSAQVSLEGANIESQATTADQTGYFSFTTTLSPLLAKEVCLTAKDQLGRLSSPACLPPFPVRSYLSVGPVLLPPTLSLNKPEYYSGQEIVISGQTIPNTDVIISLFVDPSKKSFVDYLASRLNPVKSAYAFSFPDLQTKADNKGNYSLEIPSAKSDLFRLFARSLYEKQSSPQSTRLSLKILPIWWIYLVIFFIQLLILILLMLLLIYLLRRHLAPHAIASNKALAKREKHPLNKNLSVPVGATFYHQR